MMKNISYKNIGIQSLFFIIVHIIHSQQLCSSPNVPRYGDYFPKQNKFHPGDSIIYNCTERYTLMGKDSSKCKSNGAWSNHIPFCDLKAQIRSPSIVKWNGQHVYVPQIVDGNTSTCSSFISGEPVTLTLDEPGSLYAVRLFLKSGDQNFEIGNGFASCTSYSNHIDANRWVSLQCNPSMTVSNLVKIQNKSLKDNDNTICEIEVYAKEDDSCDNPPDKSVANGYFVVSRTLAKMMCEKGYQTDGNRDRLVCEKNSWIGSRLECKEVLCNPEIDVPVAPGSEWIFLDSVSKISVGTRKQLKCRSGYAEVGSPNTIVCQNDGQWTKKNATCIQILCDPEIDVPVASGSEWIFLDSVGKATVGTRKKLICKSGYAEVGSPNTITCQNSTQWTKTNATCIEIDNSNTRMIIIGVVGAVGMMIIISLIATTIYFVKKMRREVVVVYKTPGEGCMT